MSQNTNNTSKKYKQIAICLFIMSHLYICVVDDELRKLYNASIETFNEKLGSPHRDSGFDLYTPQGMIVMGGETLSLDTNVSCAVYDDNGSPQPYYMYPRSSISKTPLRLANSVGIIDSGYRGHLIGKLDNIRSEAYAVTKHARLLQICSHNLLPFKSVTLVESLDKTERGSGGFGSTGK